MTYVYHVTVTIPVPDDFDGQCDVRDKIKDEVANVREAAKKLNGTSTADVIRKMDKGVPSTKPAVVPHKAV